MDEPVALRAPLKEEELIERLALCEMSLANWDYGHDSEYWLRYPACVRAQVAALTSSEREA